MRTCLTAEDAWTGQLVEKTIPLTEAMRALAPRAREKMAAALCALDDVKPAMKLGLGTGSTAAFFVDALGAAVAGGLDVVCVPTSRATQRQAEALNIPLTTLEETPTLDLVVDGADEFDDALTLVKGGGGALLREKIVAQASARCVIIADSSKHVAKLGRFPLPVEIVHFGALATKAKIAEAFAAEGLSVTLTDRRNADGSLFESDERHRVVDCVLENPETEHDGLMSNPASLAIRLSQTAGIVEHGLFVGLASRIYVGFDRGEHVLVKTMARDI